MFYYNTYTLQISCESSTFYYINYSILLVKSLMLIIMDSLYTFFGRFFGWLVFLDGCSPCLGDKFRSSKRSSLNFFFLLFVYVCIQFNYYLIMVYHCTCRYWKISQVGCKVIKTMHISNKWYFPESVWWWCMWVHGPSPLNVSQCYIMLVWSYPPNLPIIIQFIRFFYELFVT